ncbi:DUF4147 domain-containing protein, partial [Candidatus Omnitrophota bacterium]
YLSVIPDLNARILGYGHLDQVLLKDRQWAREIKLALAEVLLGRKYTEGIQEYAEIFFAKVYASAYKLAQNGRRKEALVFLKERLRRAKQIGYHPYDLRGYTRCLFSIAQLEFELGKIKSAVRGYLMVIRLDGERQEYYRAYMLLGVYYFIKGKNKRAVGYLREAVRLGIKFFEKRLESPHQNRRERAHMMLRDLNQLSRALNTDSYKEIEEALRDERVRALYRIYEHIEADLRSSSPLKSSTLDLGFDWDIRSLTWRVRDGAGRSKVVLLRSTVKWDKTAGGYILTNENISGLLSSLKRIKRRRGALLGVGSFHNLDIALERNAEAIILTDYDSTVIRFVFDLLRVAEVCENVEMVLPVLRDFLVLKDIFESTETFDSYIEQRGSQPARIPLLWARENKYFLRLKRLIANGRVALAHADITTMKSAKEIGRFLAQTGSRLAYVNLSNVDGPQFTPTRVRSMRRALMRIPRVLSRIGADDETIVISSFFGTGKHLELLQGVLGEKLVVLEPQVKLPAQESGHAHKHILRVFSDVESGAFPLIGKRHSSASPLFFDIELGMALFSLTQLDPIALSGLQAFVARLIGAPPIDQLIISCPQPTPRISRKFLPFPSRTLSSASSVRAKKPVDILLITHVLFDSFVRSSASSNLSPRPRDTKRIAEFYARRFAGSDLFRYCIPLPPQYISRVAQFPVLRHAVARAVAEMSPGKRLCEIGVGTGVVSEVLINDCGMRVAGVDICENLLVRAAERGVETVCARGEELPFEDESFDAVLINESIGHMMEELDEVFAEAFRVIRPSGVIHITTYKPGAPVEDFYKLCPEEEIFEALERQGFTFCARVTLGKTVYTFDYVTLLVSDEIPFAFRGEELACVGEHIHPHDYLYLVAVKPSAASSSVEKVVVIAGAKFICRSIDQSRVTVLAIEPLERQIIDLLAKDEDINYYVLHPDSEIKRQGARWVAFSQQQFLSAASKINPDYIIGWANLNFNKEIFQSSPRLKGIILFSRGYNNVDLTQARQRGIFVTNVDTGVTDAVAELNLGLILDAKFRTGELILKQGKGNTVDNLSVRAGRERRESIAQLLWAQLLSCSLRLDESEEFLRSGRFVRIGVGTTACVLHDQLAADQELNITTSLGIIGSRFFVTRLAEIAGAFGVSDISYYSGGRRMPAAQEQRLNIRYATPRELLERSDYIIKAPGAKLRFSQRERMLFKAGARIIDSAELVINPELEHILDDSLSGKKLSVAGLGKIGNALAQRAVAFGMDILALKRGPQTPKDLVSLRQVSKEELIRQADVLSLNLSLNEGTYHWLDKEELEMSREGVIIVNVGRGQLVNEQALIAFASTHPEAQVRSDVLEDETKDTNRGLAELPNVRVMPHIGAGVREVRLKMQEEAVKANFALMRKKKLPKNVVSAFPREELLIRQLFRAGVERVSPDRLMRPKIVFNSRSGSLKIDRRKYDLTRVKNIYVVGMGKAGREMSRVLYAILEERITEGVVAIYEDTEEEKIGSISLIRGDHPLPGKESLKAGRAIEKLLRKATKDDMVIALISGGGSSLSTLPIRGVSLEDVRETVRLLKMQSVPANDMEIAAILRSIDRLKNGGLREMASQAQHFVSLIISDVPYPILTASNPTLKVRGVFGQAHEILTKYRVFKEIPESVKTQIKENIEGEKDFGGYETTGVFAAEKSQFAVLNMSPDAAIGAIMGALNLECLDIGYECVVLYEPMLSGDFTGVSRRIFRGITEGNPQVDFPSILIWWGEGRVKVTAENPGKGGRNTHLALLIAKKLRRAKIDNVLILAASSDGQDGTSGFAGAVSSARTITKAREIGLNPDDYLRRFDSGTFFERLNDAVIFRETGTNVADIVIAMIQPSTASSPAEEKAKRSRRASSVVRKCINLSWGNTVRQAIEEGVASRDCLAFQATWPRRITSHGILACAAGIETLIYRASGQDILTVARIVSMFPDLKEVWLIDKGYTHRTEYPVREKIRCKTAAENRQRFTDHHNIYYYNLAYLVGRLKAYFTGVREESRNRTTCTFSGERAGRRVKIHFLKGDVRHRKKTLGIDAAPVISCIAFPGYFGS